MPDKKLLVTFLIATAIFFIPKIIFAKWDVTTVADLNTSNLSDLSGNDALNKNPSFDLDSLGHPHIVYSDGVNLCYSHFDGSLWHTEILENGQAAGTRFFAPSLKIDSNNIAHISYFDNVNKLLKYARYDQGGKVVILNIDLGSNTFPAGFSSLVLDTNNNPQLIYLTADSLSYVFFTSSGSQMEAIESSFVPFSPGGQAILAIDTNNNPYVAYTVFNSSSKTTKINYAYRQNNVWIKEEVASTGALSSSSSGVFLSLALDKNQKPALVYDELMETSGFPFPTEWMRIKYFSKEGTSWQESNFGYLRGWLYPRSLVFDSENIPHLAFFSIDEWTQSSIKYSATHSYVENGSWKSSIIDDSGLFLGVALKFDQWGGQHIAYHSYLQSGSTLVWARIRYAFEDAVAPQVSTSPLSGIFSKVQGVSLSAENEPNTTIYYTTNGSAPTISSSQYSTPIKISKPTVLKFFAKDGSGNQSEVETENYVITPTPFLYQANTIVNFRNNKVRIYNNKGKYQKKSFYPFGKKYQGSPIFLTLGNHDQESETEIFTASRSKIKVFTKSGKVTYTSKIPSYRIKVADLDLDGKSEVFFAWKNQLKVFSGGKKIATLKQKSWIKDFTVARLTNPEQPRLVVATYDNKIKIYQYKKKKFKLKKTRNLSLITFSAIDTDNNGFDELAVRKNNAIYILNSSFKTRSKIKKSGILAIADLNQDRLLEILLSTSNKLYSYQKSGVKFKKIKQLNLGGVNLGGKL